MRLIFVYNAEDGLFNALSDTVHKIFSPETYECSLCFYTYGIRGMLRKWKRFLDSLDLPLVFYHRREFFQQYPRMELPVILAETPQGLETLLSAREIDACGDLDGLIAALDVKLAPLRVAPR